MKLVSFLRNNKPTWGVVVDGGVVDCGAKLGKKYPDLKAVIANRGLADAKKLAKGKKAAAFCTYALNPGTSLQKMTSVLDSLGAEVLGGLALHRAKLPQHTEEFAARLVERANELV